MKKYPKQKSAPSPRQRIIAPGSFSTLLHQSYDSSFDAENSSITMFKLLNPSVNPNIPKIDPFTKKNLEDKKKHESDSSITLRLSSLSGDDVESLYSVKHSPKWNPCNQPRPLFGTPPPLKSPNAHSSAKRLRTNIQYYESECNGSVSRETIKSDAKGRKLYMELEEELISKKLVLHELQKTAGQVCRVFFLSSFPKHIY